MKKDFGYCLRVLLCLLLAPVPCWATVVPVIVEGISDSVRDGVQKDCKEAVLDAKIKATEKGEVFVHSKKVLDQGELREEVIKAESKGSLLPGYEIVKIGYGEDGAYHIVLVGEIRINNHQPPPAIEEDRGIQEDHRGTDIETHNIPYSFIVREDSPIRLVGHLNEMTLVTDKASFKTIEGRLGIRFFLHELGIRKIKQVSKLDVALRLLKYNSADALLSTPENCAKILLVLQGFRGVDVKEERRKLDTIPNHR